MQHFRNGVDRHAVPPVEIGEGDDDHPLRAADAKRLGPEVAEFLEMDADRGNLPGESPDDILVLLGGLIHGHRARLSSSINGCRPKTTWIKSARPSNSHGNGKFEGTVVPCSALPKSHIVMQSIAE